MKTMKLLYIGWSGKACLEGLTSECRSQWSQARDDTGEDHPRKKEQGVYDV